MITPPTILQFLSATLGMDEDATGKEALSRVMGAAMRLEGVSDPASYEKLFASSADVRQRFIDSVVVGETWFFRDRGPFTYLSRHSKELLLIQPGTVLKILSAPCATGEEAYSIAMSLLAAGLPPTAFAVSGVDISVQALNKARQACYGKGAFRGHLSSDYAAFFQETPHGRQVTKPVMNRTSFHHDNLVSPDCLAGLGPYAVIFCRNLLIYLTSKARRQVFERLDSLLLPGGLLFTGHTETIFWHQQGYLPIQWDRAFALTKPVQKPKAAPASPAAIPKPTPFSQTGKKEIKAAAKPAGSTGRKAPEIKMTPLHPSVTINGKETAGPGPSDMQPSLKQRIEEARGLADRGDMDGALRLCGECHRTFGPSADTYCLTGVIHMAKHQVNDAEDFFLKALYLDPGHYESLVHISLIFRQKGNPIKADLYRERAQRQAAVNGKIGETLKTNFRDAKGKVGDHG